MNYYLNTSPGPHEALALCSRCPACGATVQPAAVLDESDCRQTGHSCRCGEHFTETWPAVAVTR